MDGAQALMIDYRSVADLVSGIDLPGKPIGAARSTLERELARIAASSRADGPAAPRIVVVGCDESIDVKSGDQVKYGQVLLRFEKD